MRLKLRRAESPRPTNGGIFTMEKRISEMLSAIEVPTPEFPTCDVVSADKVKEMTMNKIKENGKTVSRRCGKLGRIALVAAVLVMLLGISAGAYVGLAHHDDPAGVLHSFFEQETYSKGEHLVEYETIEVDGEVYEKLRTNMPAWERMPLDEAVAEKYIYPYVYGVGESISWQGYTLTVEAVVYDANIGGGLLYYTVENPGGVEGYEVWANGEVNWPVTSPVYTALSHPEKTYIDEGQTTDTKLYLCSYFINLEDWGDFEVRLGNGAEFERDERERMVIALPGEGLGNISLNKGELVLSPLGMSLDVKALGLGHMDDVDHITLRFADGSEYTVKRDDAESYVSNMAYALGNEKGTKMQILFNSVVDIGSVAEVEIEGQVFKVK